MLNTSIPVTINQTSLKRIKLHILHLKAALLNKFLRHPLNPGQVFSSPGGTFKYRVLGVCCQLYDRSILPYPCCRLCWRGKEPFWNRQGKRFVPDTATKRSPSYCVGLVDYPEAEPFVMTLYWVKLPDRKQQWWYARRVKSVATTIQAVSTNGQRFLKTTLLGNDCSQRKLT